jgi:hypothetical protein
MKKRWIPFIALTLIVIFAIGILFGSATEVDRQSGWVARINVQNTIAVVNSDVGVVDEEDYRLNYSAAIIQALEDEFVHASPALAETGFQEGTFGAVITFPYHVSERVVSFNERYPRRIQLEFMINPNLSERDYVETYVRILNLQMSINTTLAHTYINSIFGQLHYAQNQVSAITQNKERDLTAMEIIALEQFTPSLYLENIPEIPFNPESFDGTERFTTKEGFADAVSSLYRESFNQASSSFLAMREGLFVMTEDIPNQANVWLVELEEWADEWEEYGEALGAYKERVIEVITDLNQILEDLSEYLIVVEREVVDADRYYQDLSEWHNNLAFNFSLLQRFFSDMLERIDDINNNRDIKVAYEGELVFWHLNLGDRYDMVDDWQADLGWFNTMNDRQAAALNHINAAINARPDRVAHAPAPPAASATYQEALGNWYVNVISASVGVLDDLMDHSHPQLGGQFPDGAFENLSFTPVGERPDEGFTPLSAEELDDFIPGDVGRPGLNVDPFGEELPDELNPFEYQAPRENAPLSEEGFLNPLSDIRAQIETFEVEAYLSDYLWQQVEGQIGTVGSYLDSVGGELGTHVGDNYTMLSAIYAEYVNYLRRLRQAAFDAEGNEMANLLERLERFHEVHNTTRLDTIARLIDFSDMMPESRTVDGINLALVDHTVTPFEFTPPVLREERSADMFGENSLFNQFSRFLWIGISLVLLAFLATLASCIVSSRRRGRSDNTDDEVELL